MIAQFKRYFLSGSTQFVSAFAAEVVTLAPPTLTATRTQAVNVATGQVYYVKNANTTDTTPASITKMMTCYTLLQSKTNAQLDDTVTVITADLQAGSGANLLAGDVISFRSLIADAIRPSSNAACAVIARVIGQEFLDVESGGVGDSFARFMAEMNTVSDAIGMTGSTWYNPAGLNGGDYTPPTSTNITTPTDMNRVMGLLWDYPVMPEIWDSGTQFYDMPLTRGTPTTISIELLHQMRTDTGVFGGKTGTTDVANLCTLWRAPSNDVIALSVFNGGVDGRYTDSRAIITSLPLDFPELAVVPASGASQDLLPSLFTNANVFYAPTVALAGASQDITPPLLTNVNTFYPATVAPGAVDLLPSLFTNANIFYAPNVASGAVHLMASLFANANIFYTPTVSQVGDTIVPSNMIWISPDRSKSLISPARAVAWISPSRAATLTSPSRGNA